MNKTEAEHIVKVLDAALRPIANTTYPFEISADHSGIVSMHFVSQGKHYAGGISLKSARLLIDQNTNGAALAGQVQQHLQVRNVEGRTATAGGDSEEGRATASLRATFESDLKMLRTVKKLALTLSEKVEAYASRHGKCDHNAHMPTARLSSFHHSLDDQIHYLKDAIKEIDKLWAR